MKTTLLLAALVVGASTGAVLAGPGESGQVSQPHPAETTQAPRVMLSDDQMDQIKAGNIVCLSPVPFSHVQAHAQIHTLDHVTFGQVGVDFVCAGPVL
jgi:hypothetical protein